ncbi:hypothetical protein BJX64DRAFT_250060 [Aspergillus heterothallicus]
MEAWNKHRSYSLVLLSAQLCSFPLAPWAEEAVPSLPSAFSSSEGSEYSKMKHQCHRISRSKDSVNDALPCSVQ